MTWWTWPTMRLRRGGAAGGLRRKRGGVPVGGSGAPECVFICLNFSHVSSPPTPPTTPFCRRPLPSARPVSAGTKVDPSRPLLPSTPPPTTRPFFHSVEPALFFRHNLNRRHKRIYGHGGELTVSSFLLRFLSSLLLLFVSSEGSGGGGDGGGRAVAGDGGSGKGRARFETQATE